MESKIIYQLIEQVNAETQETTIAFFWTEVVKDMCERSFNVTLDSDDKIEKGIRFIKLPNKVDVKESIWSQLSK